MKAEWKRRGLARHVHLAISRCLGPCDATNVVLVFSGATPVWLGGIRERREYQALLDWATDCGHDGRPKPLPRVLERFALERFESSCSHCAAFEEGVA
jgi:cobaltochelatase CobN